MKINAHHGDSYDQSFIANLKNVEYMQYKKYPRYRVVVVKEGEEKNIEYRSDYVQSIISPEKIPKQFMVYINSKNPQDYYVDISYLQKAYTSRILFIALITLLFVVFCITLADYLENPKESSWLRNILNKSVF